MTEEYAWGYIAGMIDGEGCVHFRTTGDGGSSRQITVVNTDKDVINTCITALLTVDIRFHLKLVARPLGRKPIWRIRVSSRDDLLRIYQHTLLCKRKERRLKNLLRSYIRRPVCI